MVYWTRVVTEKWRNANQLPNSTCFNFNDGLNCPLYWLWLTGILIQIYIYNYGYQKDWITYSPVDFNAGLIKSLRPSDAYVRQWTMLSLDGLMAYKLLDFKPLPE